MREELAAWLQCPDCGAEDLEVRAGHVQGSRIETGEVCCGCGARFPIEAGIPRMLPSALRACQSSDEAAVRKCSEMRARDEQAGAYDRMWHLTLFGLAEIPATLASLRLAPGQLLLEAGCGTGRMTREFARRAGRVVAVDFSWGSLLACRRKVVASGAANVDLVQADICRLPLRSGIFDRVVSCQVLEHIPTEESRQCAVRELARAARAGGNLAISAYQYSWWMRLRADREGEHAGGIYYRRFTRDELERLLSRELVVERMTGALMYHYIARCRKEA